MVNATYAQPGGFMWVVADATRYPAGSTKIENEVSIGKTLKAGTGGGTGGPHGGGAANLRPLLTPITQLWTAARTNLA